MTSLNLHSRFQWSGGWWISCLCFILWCGWASGAVSANEPAADALQFSGTIVKHVNGRKYVAQIFVKPEQLRLEYKYAIRTAHGYAAIEIIRLDRGEAWYLLAQQKELLITPLDPDDLLPIRASLPGERQRSLIGEGSSAGRSAQLFDVETDHRGRIDRYYEWVDRETGTVLKLVSQSRAWSFEYERIKFSPQPSYYFDEPPGYRKRTLTAPVQHAS
ncbi:hypothetical protein [Nitrospira sp. KM1]|uniref:hypothetical protein n=1 Tax=Nitrospira sp. KM1 TaxID=1936990 RepID=UPI0015669879|nr:hypothetical protein [Nitrospira sp. KM1]